MTLLPPSCVLLKHFPAMGINGSQLSIILQILDAPQIAPGEHVISIAELAAGACIKRRNTIHTIGLLIDAGYLSRKQRARGEANSYRLDGLICALKNLQSREAA